MSVQSVLSLSTIRSSLLGVSILVLGFCSILFRRNKGPRNSPPIVHIPPSELFTRPREAYSKALEAHGPIIGVYRKGRLEYVTTKRYVKDVLTQDSLFSFEEGAFKMLNLHFIRGCSLFQDVRNCVSQGISDRLDQVTADIFPLISQRVAEHIDQLCKDGEGVDHDFDKFTHDITAEVIGTLIFGDAIDRRTCEAVTDVATSLCEVMGIYQNTSYLARTFPRMWRVYIWISTVLFHFIPSLIFVLGQRVNAVADTFERDPAAFAAAGMNHTLLVDLVIKSVDSTTLRVTYARRLWIIILVAGIIFTTVHNVSGLAVWVAFEIGRRPDVLTQLRAELIQVADNDERGYHLSSESIRQASYLDSLIREVLRWKGDTLSVIRCSLSDVAIGPYVVPKGSLITPLASDVHEDVSLYGDTARTMDPFRWVDQGKGATSAGPTFIAWGLGRHACPGRYFAVNVVKLITFTLIARSTPSLDGEYEIKDPLNAAIAPTGTLRLVKLADPLI